MKPIPPPSQELKNVQKTGTVSRRDFVKTSAATWGILALGPYAGCRSPEPTPGIPVDGFRSPPLSARPMVLWAWLNGHFDRGQITRELEEMRAKGLRGPIIWDVGSIADPEGTIPAGPPFLGDESVDAIHHALDEASRLGLEVGLFASSSWNAGGPWIGPELASKQLLWAEQRVSGPVSFSEVLPLPDGLGASFTEVALLAVPDMEAEAGPAEPADLAGRIDQSGRLSWEVPPGDWTIFRFVCSGTGQTLEVPSPASDGLVVDHMSAAATDRHFEVMLDRLFRNGEKPGALTLMMLDSFEVWDRPDWNPGFAAEFRQVFGYDPLPFLPVLAGRRIHPPEICDRFLHDYRVLVSRLMISNHFARAATMLEGRGLSLLAEAGHGGYPRVDPLEALGVSHIPMGEFWNGMQFWVTKEAASAAHIYGRRDVAAEALTGWRHWRDGPAEYKRLFDIAFCAGLNRGVFHTFAHNPPEAGKPGFAYHAGEHFNVNSTWWEQAGPMVEYLSRCSHLLRQGRFVADVCFYYGDQAPNLVPSRRIDPKATSPHDEGECLHCGRPMPNRIDSLGAGYDYDYVNRDIVLRDMEVRDGRLVLSSGMEYRMIVLADRDDIALPVLRKLEQLVREGATLVGRPPLRANSLEGYPQCDEEVRDLSRLLWGEGGTQGGHRHGKGQVFPAVSLRDVLRGMGVLPDFSVETPSEHQLDYIHRRTDSEELYFVVNSADEPVDAVCSFRVGEGMSPFLWNPEDGSVKRYPVYRREGGVVRVPLKLEQISSVFVVFRAEEGGDHVVELGHRGSAPPALIDPDVEVLALAPTIARVRAQRSGHFEFRTAEGGAASIEIPDLPADIVAAGTWRLEFPENRGAPASLELDELRSWTDVESEGARAFSGTARYTTTLQVPAGYLDGPYALRLDLGEVAEIAEVSVNGNLWQNRIVGDLRFPEAGEFALTNLKHKFTADMDLLPSGLIGPVVLRPTVEVDVPL